MAKIQQDNFTTKIGMYILIFVMLCIIFIGGLNSVFSNATLDYDVTIELQTTSSDIFQLFYKAPEIILEDGTVSPERFNEEHSKRIKVNGGNPYQKIVFTIPSSGVEYLRLDLGSANGVSVKIKEIRIESISKSLVLDFTEIPTAFTVNNHIGKLSDKNYTVSTKTIGTDPYISNGEPFAVVDRTITVPVIGLTLAILCTVGLLLLEGYIKNKKKATVWTADNVLTAILAMLVIVTPLIITLSGVLTIFLTVLFLLISAILIFMKLKAKGINISEKIKTQFPAFLMSALFCIVIFSSFLVGAFSTKTYNYDENTPTFALSSFNRYPIAFTNYYDKNLTLKNTYEGIYGNLKTHVLSDSLSEAVVIGKDGWLFSNGTLTDYKRTNAFSTTSLDNIKEKILNYERVLFNNGIQFYFLVVPNKNSVYSDFMPSNIRRANRVERIEQVYTHLYKYSDIKVVEIWKQLKAATTNNTNLYYKTDPLLTQDGALITIEQLTTFLKTDFPEFKELDLTAFEKTERTSKLKSLATLMDRSNEYDEKTYIYNPKNTSYEFLSPGDPSVNFRSEISEELTDLGQSYQLSDYINLKNPNALNDLKVYMIRDEFAVNLIPFLNEMFTECTYVWDYTVRTDAIMAETPDVVIYEISQNDLAMLAKG